MTLIGRLQKWNITMTHWSETMFMAMKVDYVGHMLPGKRNMIIFLCGI